MKIHIIDDEKETRKSCQFLINQLGFQEVSLWGNGADFYFQAELFEPAIAIVDLRMPFMTGQDLLARLSKRQSPISCIVLTGHGDVEEAVNALKQGAVDFLEKPVAMQKLSSAIRVAQGASLERYKKYRLLQSYQALSEREKMVSQHVFLGLTNKQISEQLNVSVRTIEVQRANAMRKMNVTNLAEFIALLSLVDEVLEFKSNSS